MYGKINQMSLITLKADIPAYGGLSIGKWNGKVVMIKGAIPGETVEARIEEEKKDYCTAAAVAISNPSPDRIEPACKYFGSCGGCRLQYITYKRQIRLKEEILHDCLKRFARIDKGLSQSIVSDNPWNYRFRGQFKITGGKIGFYREKTREVIDIDECPLMAEEVNGHLKKAREMLKDIVARELHISCGDGAIALIKGSNTYKEDWNRLMAAFLNSGFSGVFVDL
ncbi:MAG: class I SAM-dependent RNA methyltransferase, partial [Nitrospirae bacterium]|nr:class I SAM-dependent RNA methyltransferase [Nitrospirota bacterium]